MLKDLLDAKNCFKLVCGAGNENIEEVKKLVYIYSKAGCRFFDLSANEKVIDIAKEALKLAEIDNAYLCVSVGIKNDPHVNKARISQTLCDKCNTCIKMCPQNAINNYIVDESKCIGCSKCNKICKNNAITFISKEKNLNEILPSIIGKGIDCIEFHAMGLDEEEIDSKWKYINNSFDGFLSICTSRGKLSDEAMVFRIKQMIKDRKPYSTIIQADGYPMSGGENDYKTTLQAVATAEIVENEKIPIYLLLSGGTNSKTSELAKLCNVNYDGISIGSYARKIVKDYISNDEFWNNKNIQNEAIQVAKDLINTVRG